MKYGILFIFIITLLFSCNYKFKFIINPKDSEIIINDNILSDTKVFFSKNKKIDVKINRKGYSEFRNIYKKMFPFGIKNIHVKLKPEIYDLEIKTIDASCDIYFDSKKIGTTPGKLELEYGVYDMTLSYKNYPDQEIRVESKRDSTLLFRPQKNPISIKQVGIFDCGSQPKQVIFSPDLKYVYLLLLDGYGFEVFDMDTLSIISKVDAPMDKELRGFAEGLFIKEKKVFLLSQMTTGRIYEYSYPENEFKRTIDTKGLWSKFIAWSGKHQMIAISNWSSNDVSIIDYSTGKLKKKIRTAQSPRGLAFSSDGKYLYVSSYEGGMIHKFNTSNWIEEKHIYKNYAAMRHIVITKDDSKIYVSNMYHNEVYEITTNDFQIINTYKVFDNPNTISLTPDDKYLYISCRGPNDPETYLKRSPVNGRIEVINLIDKKTEYSFEAGNQTTGLDISVDGKYLCFSNFRDDNLELYWIGR